jgi:hypothetical protein
MSQVPDVAEKEIEEPMEEQVMTTTWVKFMCFCWVLFTFNKYAEFLASLVICIHATVGLCRMGIEHSLW